MRTRTEWRPGAEPIELLFRAEYAPMVRLAYTLVNNNAEAEELVQDSFAEVYRRHHEIEQPGAYLRTTVVSRCRSALRRRRTMQTPRPRPPSDLPEAATELWDVLDKLPEDHRIAIVLRYYGQYRASEIANILDLRPSTVRSHLRRGLLALRRELES